MREEIRTEHGDVCQEIEMNNDPVYGGYVCMNHVRSTPAPLHDCAIGELARNLTNNVVIIFSFIGNSQWGLCATQLNPDWLFITQARIFSADWFTLEDNGKAISKIHMPCLLYNTVQIRLLHFRYNDRNVSSPKWLTGCLSEVIHIGKLKYPHSGWMNGDSTTTTSDPTIGVWNFYIGYCFSIQIIDLLSHHCLQVPDSRWTESLMCLMDLPSMAALRQRWITWERIREDSWRHRQLTAFHFHLQTWVYVHSRKSNVVPLLAETPESTQHVRYYFNQ